MRLPLAAFFLSLLAIAGFAAEGAAPEVLTTCASVRALSREQAAQGIPVRVRGVVTLLPFQPADQFTFTLDDGTGIWVSPVRPEETADLPAQLRTGDVVEVVGRTLDGRFSPTISGQQVRVVGRGELPKAQEVTVLGLSSGKFDCQRVVISGVVQAAEHIRAWPHPQVRLLVRSEIGPFNYFLLDARDQNIDGLVDSVVSLTGVCLSFFNSRGQFLGARIYSNNPADMRVQQPGVADAFSAPEVTLARVMAFSPEGMDLHRRRVRGVVTACRPGEYFFLQDGAFALRVNTRQSGRLEPGEVVEAAGFFELTHHRAEMHEAVFRRMGKAENPAPVDISREAAFTREPQTVYAPPQDYDDRLVSMRGRFVSLDQKEGEPVRLNLIWDDALVSAEFIDPGSREFLETLRPGSELRVTGVCQLRFSASRPVVDWPQPIALSLLVRGPADVEVLRAAAFWTPQRLITAMSVLIFVLMAVLAWVVLLRRQVTQRGAQLAEEMRARRDAAVEFESSLRERNRLAADLHDTMEQSLTGLALQIEASQALHDSTPDQSQRHLSLARQLLARSREDLRRSIWNLRANPLEKQTLAEALQEIVADRSATTPVKITVECEGEPRPLQDFVAGNMLLLAQEGITNALKHAEATRIDLGLVFKTRTVTLAIRDNGKGFDPATAAGPKSGHFGLQGMRERVKRLGGQFSMTSTPGKGTTIVATVTD